MSSNVHYTLDNLASRFYHLWDSEWIMHRSVDRAFGYHDFHLHEEFTSLQPMYLESEMSFREGHFWTKANRTLWWLSLVASAFYLIFVFVGQRVMRNKKAFDLKGLLAAWNLFLAVFSIIGTARLVPHVLYGFLVNHHSYFFCRAASEAYGQGPSGLWVNLFVWSKLIELFDTVFLVLRKKPVSFLHWFHHATVLMYCWHAGQYQMPTGVFFATMNYVVHSIMYFYYFLAAVTKPPRWGKIVTILQIVQMFIGMFVTSYHYYLLKTVPNCDGSFSNLTAAFVMYTAYMLLFMEFFVSRYFASKSRTKTDSVSDSNKRKEE